MKIVKIIAVVLIVFFAIVWAIGGYLTVDDLAKCGAAPSTKQGCEPAEAIVAVSGGDTSARAAEAITLYKNGWADLLIFSGAAADKSGPSNAKVMQQQAIDAGVDPDDISIEEISETTEQNAEKTAELFEKYSISSAIIVTSGYHERRTMLEFSKQAPHVALRAHPVAQDSQWGAFWWLTPTGWTLAVPEVIQSLILSTGAPTRSEQP